MHFKDHAGCGVLIQLYYRVFRTSALYSAWSQDPRIGAEGALLATPPSTIPGVYAAGSSIYVADSVAQAPKQGVQGYLPCQS